LALNIETTTSASDLGRDREIKEGQTVKRTRAIVVHPWQGALSPRRRRVGIRSRQGSDQGRQRCASDVKAPGIIPRNRPRAMATGLKAIDALIPIRTAASAK